MSIKTSSETVVEPVTASQSDLTAPTPSTGFRKGSAFWLTFIAVLVCTFVSALDLTAVSVALPTITESLHGGGKFVWHTDCLAPLSCPCLAVLRTRSVGAPPCLLPSGSSS